MKLEQRVVIMIDEETWGTRPDAVVTQLAFVAVDLDDPEMILRQAEVYLPIQPQLALDRKIDADTIINFWFQQEGAYETHQMNLGNDMDELVALVGSIHAKITEVIGDADYVEVFSRGSDFDFPIAQSLFDMVGLPQTPWAYNKKYDLRTTMLEAGISTSDVERPAGLKKHHALSDCKYQLMCLFEARRQMRASKVVHPAAES